MAKTMNGTKAAVTMDAFLATLQNTTAKPVVRSKSKSAAVDIGELLGGGKPDIEPIQVNKKSAEAVDVSLEKAEMPTASFLQPTRLEEKSPEKPVLLEADINAPALAALIDTAAKYTTALSIQNSMGAEDPTLHLTAAVVAAKIDGKATVTNMSIEFLHFLTDCCAAMFG